MVSAATLAPVRASISTPVLWRTSTRQRTTITGLPGAKPISIRHCSSASGWQNGISSEVRLAAMTPATIAVSNTGPFFVRWPLRRRARATAAGTRTRASASAIRWVMAFAPTSTIVGRERASRCDRPVLRVRRGMRRLAPDVIHLDVLHAAGAQFVAQFTVAVRAPLPHRAHQLQQFLVAGTTAQRRPQIGALGREQAGVELAVRGQARARAVAAETLRKQRR